MTSLAVAKEASCLVENAWICPEYVRTRRGELIEATTDHLIITVAAVGLGLALAFPLALVARRFRRAEGLVLGTSTALYTVPSLAMFALLLPILGLGADTVIVGLALYSLTILVRNLLTGLDGVPDDVVESARGMGFGTARLLFRVELPLALPALMAGLRIATVSTVALTTVGILVGAGGLGLIIDAGYNMAFNAPIFTGSVLCILMAVTLDVLLVGIQRILTPWSRARVAAT